MKEIFKYLGILMLITFSFYYTDKISTMIVYKSDLMQEILSNKNTFEKDYVDAQINGDYIIPGINGLKVNELDSYYKMKKDYVFSADRIVFEEVVPKNTIENHKNLKINKGNYKKKMISLIIKDNSIVKDYCEKNKIKGTLLSSYETFEKNTFLEPIYYEGDLVKLDILLDKYKMNKNICFINSMNVDKCINNNKYLVEESYYVDNISIIGSKINSGDILYISDELTLDNFKVLLKKISYRDLDIAYLSDLISEKNNQ